MSTCGDASGGEPCSMSAGSSSVISLYDAIPRDQCAGASVPASPEN